MSILSGYKKVKDYILTSTGYQLLSRWTDANTVEADDGKTLQTKVGAINGIAKTYNEITTTTDSSFAASATAVKEGFDSVNGKLAKYVDIDVQCGAETWCTVSLPAPLPSANQVINVCRALDDNANVYGIIWWASSGRQLTILRINTDGTNLRIENTAKSIKLRIWYTP